MLEGDIWAIGSLEGITNVGTSDGGRTVPSPVGRGGARGTGTVKFYLKFYYQHCQPPTLVST